jgi:Gpi18-like mannosyltransferase
MTKMLNKIFSQIDSGMKKVLIFFLVWFFVLNVVGYIANVYEIDNYGHDDETHGLTWHKVLIAEWLRWDSGFFHDIAGKGYHPEPGDGDYFFTSGVRTAFFPLYPAIIRYTGQVINADNSTLYTIQRLVSIISIFIAVIFFYKLVRLDEDENVGLRSVMYLLLYPSAFFFLAGYSESLFLMLLVSSIYFSRKSNWLLAGVLGGLAVSSRFVGVLIILPLLYEYLDQRKFKWREIKVDILYLMLVFLGLGIYMLYLNKSFGNPTMFVDIENSYGKHMTLNIFSVFIKNFMDFFKNPFAVQYIQHLHEYIAALLFFVSAIVSYFKLRKSYFIYAISYMLLILLMGNIGSFNRFVLLAFPVFILWAKLIKNEFAHQLLIFILASFLIVFTAFFTIGRWSG